MSAEISRGIIRAHQNGIVTSASLLGNCAELDAARGLLAEAPNLGVGVHLTLIGGRPVSDATALRSLTDGSGAFFGRSSDFVARWLRKQVDPREVEREFDAQIDRIRSAGIVPDHLDTHHHL